MCAIRRIRRRSVYLFIEQYRVSQTYREMNKAALRAVHSTEQTREELETIAKVPSSFISIARRERRGNFG